MHSAPLGLLSFQMVQESKGMRIDFIKIDTTISKARYTAKDS